MEGLRKTAVRAAVIGLAVMLALPVPAAHAGNHPVSKFFRGVVNIGTSPVEIPRQIRAQWIEQSAKTDNFVVWLVTGTVSGVIQGVKRLGSGAWDVLTFPVEVPAGYESLIKPDYVLDDWPERPAAQ